MNTQSRTAWRNVTKAAGDLNVARRLSKKSPLLSDADARRRFALAMDEAPPIRKVSSDEQGWATLEIFGVTPTNLSTILEALGAPENVIKEAMTDPELAYQMLKEYGRNYKEQQQ